ncbi:hypothetical protein FOVG_12658 [Fusarium oxysporum f. sp. pisi HDV247]|uniref:Uncharacterized protein n=1 Tax=Fusarium oxysporum f. sp. pisi HDV247 TaxID=1080344 RepID=W9PA20_FUSOX|nr:hypothetical protein FOVG_12658 [Fusarium oxysporum f. sp. pisi HDV247]
MLDACSLLSGSKWTKEVDALKEKSPTVSSAVDVNEARHR